jgi:hypothetical protein
MTYRIEGLAPDRFRALFALDDEALHAQDARRVVAASDSGYPCRVSLEEARAGEELILLNFVSHDVPTPFRTAYAIYVREQAHEPARFEDEVPPLLASRTLGLRGFDSEGMLHAGLLAMPGEADRRIRELLADPEIATIHVHSATYGCFLACIERNGSC